MALEEYITTDDITDNLTKNYDMTEHVNDANDALEHLAKERGVYPEDIETPVSYKIKKYAVYYAMMLFCLDNIGVNNNDVPSDIEKYNVKYKHYSSLVENLANKIGWRELAGEDYQRKDYVSVNKVFYG